MGALLLPAGLPQQFANCSFLLAALASDVLLIRLFLVSAYIFLLSAAVFGLPKWPNVLGSGSIALDTLVWAVLCLLFHGFALFRLLRDERFVTFSSEDEEQLWRFFYRRSGMGRLEMKQVLKHGCWRRVSAGSVIVHGHEARLRFFLLVEGQATLRAMYKGLPGEPRQQYSGCCLDIGLLNTCGIFIGFEKDESQMLSAVADTDCLLYSWSIDELAQMATKCSPAVATFWRNFTLCQLGMYFAHNFHPSKPLMCATGEPEPLSLLKGGRSRDFTDALREYELPQQSWRSWLAWLKRSFHPFPPAGLRHNTLPITGIMARNRLIALKAAHTKAEIERAALDAGMSQEAAGEASAHGGQRAFEMLAEMQALQRIDETAEQELIHEIEAQVEV